MLFYVIVIIGDSHWFCVFMNPGQKRKLEKLIQTKYKLWYKSHESLKKLVKRQTTNFTNFRFRLPSLLIIKLLFVSFEPYQNGYEMDTIKTQFRVTPINLSLFWDDVPLSIATATVKDFMTISTQLYPI